MIWASDSVCIFDHLAESGFAQLDQIARFNHVFNKIDHLTLQADTVQLVDAHDAAGAITLTSISLPLITSSPVKYRPSRTSLGPILRHSSSSSLVRTCFTTRPPAWTLERTSLSAGMRRMAPIGSPLSIRMRTSPFSAPSTYSCRIT